MEILKVDNLCKDYPSFSLKNVSFSINSGEILGFIGRNGAGKTTTLKSIMKLIHFDSGKIIAFGKDMAMYELENKQRIGFALSELNYYPNRTIGQISKVMKRFYKDFDDKKYDQLCGLFNLDTKKKLQELSSGMKVKFQLAIALCHNAELLILDEPTSGLDPISRDEVLDIFKKIVSNGDRAILFSTHITSDLDKCATNITYIHDGVIQFTGTKKEFVGNYRYVPKQKVPTELLSKFIFNKVDNYEFEGLINREDEKAFVDAGVKVNEPDLEEIMVSLERSKDKHEEFTL